MNSRSTYACRHHNVAMKQSCRLSLQSRGGTGKISLVSSAGLLLIATLADTKPNYTPNNTTCMLITRAGHTRRKRAIALSASTRQPRQWKEARRRSQRNSNSCQQLALARGILVINAACVVPIASPLRRRIRMHVRTMLAPLPLERPGKRHRQNEGATRLMAAPRSLRLHRRARLFRRRRR